MMGQLSQSQDLGAGLKSRHVTMLSIAGVIGAEFICRLQRRHCRGRPGGAAGLSVCRAAGGDDYAYAGRNGGRATPDTGSFSTYADKAIGRWAGYTIRLAVLVVLGPGYSAGSQYRGDYSAFVGAGRPGVVVLPGHHSRPLPAQ